MTNDSQTENATDSRTGYEPQWLPEGRPEVSGPDIDSIECSIDDVLVLSERGEAAAWMECEQEAAVELEDAR